MAYAYERDEEHEVPARPGLGGKLRDIFGSLGRRDEFDDDEYDEPGRPVVTYNKGVSGTRPDFRVATVTQQSITVMPAASFADAQKAADRLKQGEAQIVNFEKTPLEIAERLTDFLNGITYALDGYVEKVGERVFLFTPANVVIHADGPEAPQPRPFFDRS